MEFAILIKILVVPRIGQRRAFVLKKTMSGTGSWYDGVARMLLSRCPIPTRKFVPGGVPCRRGPEAVTGTASSHHG